jgi:RNA polymerase-binding transcription factor DksA
MATKKPTTKKVAAKPVAKKAAAKPVAKKAAKPVAKPVVKKAAAKPVAKPIAKKAVVKPAAKPVVKKAPAKPVAKAPAKPVAKPVAKKVAPTKSVAKSPAKPVAKPAAKPVAKKAAPVKVVAKPEVKKEAPKKPQPKVEAKVSKPVVEKKVAPPKEKEVVAKPAPTPEPKAAKPAKSGKKSSTKTIITSIGANMPKKLDVFKTNTFGTSNLKNETGKVIAHRKTSELKRNNDAGAIKKYEPEHTRSILDMSPNKDTTSYRYSDDDLQEFRELIMKKLETAKTELQYLQGVIMRKDEGGTEDTENKYQSIEDGSASMDREQFNQLASRQITFISHLEQALVRIENKTYGICRETGKLIDKARLRAVPHATLSIEAKNAKKN